MHAELCYAKLAFRLWRSAWKVCFHLRRHLSVPWEESCSVGKLNGQCCYFSVSDGIAKRSGYLNRPAGLLKYILNSFNGWKCLLLKWSRNRNFLLSSSFIRVDLWKKFVYILGLRRSRLMFVFLEINIKLGENRIAVLRRWNYLKVCWGWGIFFSL